MYFNLHEFSTIKPTIIRIETTCVDNLVVTFFIELFCIVENSQIFVHLLSVHCVLLSFYFFFTCSALLLYCIGTLVFVSTLLIIQFKSTCPSLKRLYIYVVCKLLLSCARVYYVHRGFWAEKKIDRATFRFN